MNIHMGMEKQIILIAILITGTFLATGCGAPKEGTSPRPATPITETDPPKEGGTPEEEEPPTIYGEEIDPAGPCNVDFPHFHMESSPTIADLDADYDNKPFRRGADLYTRYIAGTLNSPGRYLSLRPDGSLAAVHLFYIEFPVNSAALCIGKAWEHNEMWARVDPGARYALIRDSRMPINGIPDPGPDMAPNYHWVVGTGRTDPSFPEALILVDAPGPYRFSPRLEFGQYINQRANIHDSAPPWTIRGTASLRLFLRYEGGVFNSGLAGSAAGGTRQVGPIDPNVSGYPANAPALIPDVFGGHPQYLGN